MTSNKNKFNKVQLVRKQGHSRENVSQLPVSERVTPSLWKQAMEFMGNVVLNIPDMLQQYRFSLDNKKKKMPTQDTNPVMQIISLFKLGRLSIPKFLKIFPQNSIKLNSYTHCVCMCSFITSLHTNSNE